MVLKKTYLRIKIYYFFYQKKENILKMANQHEKMQ